MGTVKKANIPIVFFFVCDITVETQYNEVIGIPNDIFRPITSKIYEKEPRCNDV